MPILYTQLGHKHVLLYQNTKFPCAAKLVLSIKIQREKIQNSKAQTFQAVVFFHLAEMPADNELSAILNRR